MNGANGNNLLSVTKAAQLLGVTPQAVYQAIREGRVVAITIVDKMGIPYSEITRLRRAQRAKLGTKQS